MSRSRCVLKVRGLDCPAEIPPIRAALERAPGVAGLAFDPTAGTVAIDFDPTKTAPAALARRVAEGAGMAAEPMAEGPATDEAGARDRRAGRLRRALVSGSGGALGAGVGLAAAGRPTAATIAYGVAVVLGSAELVPKALASLRRRRLDIHVLMGLAVIGALWLGQADEAATVSFLFGLSEALEAWSLGRARRAVRGLLEIAPPTAERIGPDGRTRTVTAAELAAGDRVLVRAGMRVPVDGRVAAGRSSVDQKSITGESLPVPKGPGDPVYAGTVNGEGALEVEAAAPVAESVAAKAVELVRAAQAGRAPTERAIERFAAWYTPCAVALAAAVAVGPPLVLWATGAPGAEGAWRTWLGRGLVVLVASCPCALVIGTPVAVVAALAAAARRGVLIKGGQFLEAVGRLRVIAFDKTGTLTRGEPAVVEVVPAAGGGGDELLRVAAALGDRGGHVVGRAIARHARESALEFPAAEGYTAVPGLGATGRVGAEEYHLGNHRFLHEAGLCEGAFHGSFAGAEAGGGTAVGLGGSRSGPLGWIRLADRARPEAAGALGELRALGLRTVMLTGDSPTAAGPIAAELGVADPRAGLLPADKARAVAELDAAEGPVGMVGDGVNDAPALAAARVSVALGGIGSAAAIEAADVVLMADDLARLPWLVRHSRRALATIRLNIALAVGSKLLVLGLAVVGLAGLWAAIAADLGVSLLVIALALRLLRPGD